MSQRILVIKLSSLGDLFCALPAVRMIKQGLNATIDWVTQAEYVDLVNCFEDVDRVIGFPRRNFLLHAGAYLHELRHERYDQVLDLQGLLKSALLVGRAARAGRRIGPSNPREGARHFYNDIAGPRNTRRHAVDELLDMVRRLGLDLTEPEFPVKFPSCKLKTTRPRVAFVPGSRWEAKNWTVEGFAHVGQGLQAEKNATVYLVGGPADEVLCNGIAEKLDAERTENRAGCDTLIETGSLLREMDLVVSVDSGPMHMAVACGVPVLAVFGATDPRRTGPYGEGNRVIMAPELADDPDLARAYRRRDTIGAWQVDQAEVARNALEMLG